jgi:hypothetical protein
MNVVEKKNSINISQPLPHGITAVTKGKKLPLFGDSYY